MHIKISGLNKLKKLQKRTQELSEIKSIPITDLLTDSFLMKHTDFNSFVEFENCQIFTKYSDFEDIPDEEIDEFIRNNSVFNSWEDLINAATEEFIINRLTL